MAPVTTSKIIRMHSTPTPAVLVILATLLLTCNILWLYTAPSQPQKNVCGYLVDSWTGSREGAVTAHTGSGGSMNGSTSGVAAPPPSAVHDYQLVRGSGLRDVPFPIPIPNDTVLLGEDLGPWDGLPPRYLTIGIASVWRKEQYLYRTLDSLLKETTDQDKKDIFIFLLLADADPDFRVQRARELEVRYSTAIADGVLLVLQPTSLLYPTINFGSIWRTYGDSVSRVQWRTKQVLDFAFLFWYTWTRKPSKYYMILEDDLLSARHFVTAVRDFVNLHEKRHWIALQLTAFMGIGQLIRCEDMDRLVSFLLLFYREHPVDVLVKNWIALMGPQKPPKAFPYRRVPGLFQHVGIHSTLANKTQPLKDRTFRYETRINKDPEINPSLVKRRYAHINPPADVVTTISQYKSFVAAAAYSPAPGMFWGMPKAGDTYDVIFAKPLNVTRIVIITGATVPKTRVRERLLYGQLQVSPMYKEMVSPSRALCLDFVPIVEFRDGEVDIKDLDSRFKKGIQCIRIVIGNQQKTWISISEIAIFVRDGDLNSKAIDGTFNIVGGGPSSLKTAETATGDGSVGPPASEQAPGPEEGTEGHAIKPAVADGTVVEGKLPTKVRGKVDPSLPADIPQNTIVIRVDEIVSSDSPKELESVKSVNASSNSSADKLSKPDGGGKSINNNGTSVPKDRINVPVSGVKKETSGEVNKISGSEGSEVSNTISAVEHL